MELPDQWDYVVHFTGRKRSKSRAVPPHINKMTPHERLSRIVPDAAINAYPPYGCRTPVVSFTEAVRSSLEALLFAEQFQPWGLVFNKSVVYREGGGPVWYARDDLWAAIPDPLHAWAVRTTAPDGRGARISQWMHEREWRVVPGPDSPAEFAFSPADLHAIIVPQHMLGHARALLEHSHFDPRVWMWNPTKRSLWEFRRFGAQQ